MFFEEMVLTGGNLMADLILTYITCFMNFSNCHDLSVDNSKFLKK